MNFNMPFPPKFVSLIALVLTISNSAFATNASIEPNKTILDLIPNMSNGARIYRLCAACHGEDASGDLNGQFPLIAGQHQSILIKQIKDIQNKKRSNPSMFPFVDDQTLGGDQGLADVTAFIASLPIIPRTTQLKLKIAIKGKALYAQHCAECHGEDGAGNAEKLIPRIQGQHINYLVRELAWFKDKTRYNPDPIMLKVIAGLTEQQLKNIAQYINTLPD